MSLVRYVTDSDYSSANPLCNTSARVPECRQSGWLYWPGTSGNHPAIVLSHSGSDGRKESDYCPIVEYFVGKGTVVLVAVRRGYAGDAGLGTNTGELPGTTLDLVAAGNASQSRSPLAESLRSQCDYWPRGGALSVIERDCVNAALQFNQVSEIKAALDYVRGLPATDEHRIALIGHGAGANITAMAALFENLPGVELGVSAAVLLSAGENGWDADHPYLKDMLKNAVRQREFPMAFLQPKNAEDVMPTERFADLAITTQDFHVMATLMPAVLNADSTEPTPEQIRNRFATRAKEVKQWAPLAWRFINLYVSQ